MNIQHYSTEIDWIDEHRSIVKDQAQIYKIL